MVQQFGSNHAEYYLEMGILLNSEKDKDLDKIKEYFLKAIDLNNKNIITVFKISL